MEKEPILKVPNRHAQPFPHQGPMIASAEWRISYFENSSGEQLLFRCTSRGENARVWMGDLDWAELSVVRYDGEPRLLAGSNLIILQGDEQDWLSLCVRTHSAVLPNWEPPAVMQKAADAMLRMSGLRRSRGSLPDIRVFVSSPSQLREERVVVAKVCAALSRDLGVRIEPMLWEGGGPECPDVPPFPPRWTQGGAQSVIDEQVWERMGGYDIYVGIIWHRMGTPTAGYRSGTEAEYRAAVKWKKELGRPFTILFYRKMAPIPPDGLRGSQFDQVEEFLVDIQRENLVQQFSTSAEFEAQLQIHLTLEIQQLLDPEGSDALIPALRRQIARRAKNGQGYARCPECGGGQLEKGEDQEVDVDRDGHASLSAEIPYTKCMDCGWKELG